MAVHLDGARIANAAAALGLPLRAFTTDVGVDVLSFGGTKNGLLFGEGVVVLNPDAVSGRSNTCASCRCSWPPRCASSRCSSRRCSPATCGCAAPARQRDGAAAGRCDRDIAGVQLTATGQANAVFAILPARSPSGCRSASVLLLGRATGEVRWMCAFDTTEADVDAFADMVRKEMARPLAPAHRARPSVEVQRAQERALDCSAGIQCQWLRSQTCQPPFAKSETKSCPLPVDALLLGSCGKWTSTTHV